MQQTNSAFPANYPSGGPLDIAGRGADAHDDNSLRRILLQYWQAAVRWRLLIASIILVCLAAAFVETLLTAPLYRAAAEIQIGRAQKNITNVQDLNPNMDDDEEFYATQYALLRARSLAERVAYNLHLADAPDFFAANGVKLPTADSAGAGNPAERKQREQLAAGLLLGGIAINPVKGSSLVEIGYTSRSPQWSERIANAWPQEFINANIDRQFASTADARRYLEQRLSVLRMKIEQGERDLITFAADHNIVTLGASRDASGRTEEPRTLVASNLEALNTALMTARTDRLLGRKGAENNDDTLTNDTVTSLNSKRAEVAADYARLLTQFESGYPAVRALKAEMAALDDAIAREAVRVRADKQAADADTVKRENDLSAQVQTLKSQFDQQQRDTIQYNIYQRDVDTDRQLYDALLQHYKNIGVAGDVGATNIIIVDQAKLPGGPFSPNLQLNLLMGLLAGIILSAGAVSGLTMIDEGLHDPNDVEKLVQLPLLGGIPLSDTSPESMLSDPKSHLSEAYFSVHMALTLATDHGFPKSLVVTSAQPSEGKSISALALASTIGRTGKRVLLVDADLRSPSVHNLLKAENTRGLSNILAGETDYMSFIQKSDMKGVSMLPSGPNPPSVAELLSTDRIRDVLAELQKHFDHIVIDAPPVIGLADAPLLVQAAEGCVFVIAANQVAIRAARGGIQRLRVGSNHIFGAIVTKVDHNRHGYSYGEYYYGQ